MRAELMPRDDTGIISSMNRTFVHLKTGEPAVMDTGGRRKGSRAKGALGSCLAYKLATLVKELAVELI